jgi:hypothetical protein
LQRAKGPTTMGSLAVPARAHQTALSTTAVV